MRRIRFGTCKRNPAKLMNSLPALRAGAAAFLAQHTQYAEWQVEFCAIAPHIPSDLQVQLQAAGVIPQPLQSLLALLAQAIKRQHNSGDAPGDAAKILAGRNMPVFTIFGLEFREIEDKTIVHHQNDL